ncbi:Uncharacterized protein APZ42_026164 [Daphnia magna]|uniref:Uncharacterized protein n=1 Tax=Daphnia magna TaxID=35525 RepID=A0A162EDW6_9CRUS|nr:Uncharacterized protein APZ42_026164 [Daphnia magna]
MGQRNREKFLQHNKGTKQTDNETLQNEEEDEEGRRKEIRKKEREGRKLYNETAQNEVYDDERRSKGIGKQKKEGRESDNETVQNKEEDEEGWDKEMKKRKQERRHMSTEAAKASETAAAEAESYQITVKANRSFANRAGAVTRSKLAIENRDPKLAQLPHVKINRRPSLVSCNQTAICSPTADFFYFAVNGNAAFVAQIQILSGAK